MLEIDALTAEALPPVDGLYIGGGFPETHAEKLANNQKFRQSLKNAIEAGLPVYAECGGLMYLGENIIVREQSYPMVGALPFTVLLEKKPQGHGYTIIEVDQPNPYFPIGTRLLGHEFHYSRIIENDVNKLNLVFRLERGHGITGHRDGISYKNVLATYSHTHALATPAWAIAFLNQARKYRTRGLQQPDKDIGKSLTFPASAFSLKLP